MRFLFSLVLAAFIMVAPLRANPTHNPDTETAVLEYFGGSSALIMYNTFLCIGLTSDLFTGGVYTADFAKTILLEQVNSIASLQQQLTRVLDKGLFTSAADEEFMLHFGDVLDMLIDMSDALYSYVQSGESGDQAFYDNIRMETWKEIAYLLGIE